MLRVPPKSTAAVLSAAALLLLGSVAFAQEQVLVTRVEEDWQLVVGEPDPNVVAPQITCVMSPTQDLKGVYLLFDVNHQNHPDFVAGGVQLQVWNGEQAIAEKKYPNTLAMASPNEVVTWTQAMELAGGNFVFEITKGASTTWGAFGGQGFLKTAVAADVSSLNGYSPAFSVQNSGTGYGANRVASLVLKRVRYYTSSGLLTEVDVNAAAH